MIVTWNRNQDPPLSMFYFSVSSQMPTLLAPLKMVGHTNLMISSCGFHKLQYWIAWHRVCGEFGRNKIKRILPCIHVFLVHARESTVNNAWVSIFDSIELCYSDWCHCLIDERNNEISKDKKPYSSWRSMSVVGHWAQGHWFSDLQNSHGMWASSRVHILTIWDSEFSFQVEHTNQKPKTLFYFIIIQLI